MQKEDPAMALYQFIYKPLNRPQMEKECDHHSKNPFFRLKGTIFKKFDTFFDQKKQSFSQIKSVQTEQDLPEEIEKSDKRKFLKSFTVDYSWRPNDLSIQNQIKVLFSISKYKKPFVKPLNLYPYPRLNTKTIVFDLDETLIHASMKESKGSQRIVMSMKSNIFINIRPHLIKLLEEIRPFYEIMVFTTSEKEYADAILNYLDPTKSYFDQRLYRSDCTVVNNYFIKDLRMLGRNLRDVAIVDNTLISFAFQVSNGIPIDSYFGGDSDNELLKLSNYLLVLKDKEDIREYNDQNFDLAANNIYNY